MKRRQREPKREPAQLTEEDLRAIARVERIQHVQRTRGDIAKMRTRLGLQ